MDQHYGQIVERIVRRNGYSITELARLTNVNRRSVYNWFNQKHLKTEIIYRIGNALDYDFSVDLPQLFSSGDFDKTSSFSKRKAPASLYGPESFTDNIWKTKYIRLLEDFHILLSAREKMSNNSTSET